MSDLTDALSRLFRPKLLLRAARYGLQSYNRSAQLSRILGPGSYDNAIQTAHKLADMEKELDAQRVAKDASYSPARHVKILTALLSELDRIRAAEPIPFPKSATRSVASAL